MELLILLSFVPVALFTSKICKKNNFLLSLSGGAHQKFISKKPVPLIGGFFIIVFSLIFFDNFLVKLFLLFIYFIGFCSDLKIISKPTIRIIIQIFIIALFIFIVNLNLENTRIQFLDHLLKNSIFNNLFLTFCILIIINGSNFIDGVNINTLAYYLIITTCLIFLSNDYNVAISKEILTYFFIFILILIILNLNKILFLGDSGSYLLGFLFSYILIDLYLKNQEISPFFIILLLWYPAFENFFSLSRRLKFNRSPLYPDNSHLHHLLRMYFFINKKLKKYNENLPGLLINIVNLIFFFFGFLQINQTKFQIFLIICLIIIYLIVYTKLIKK